MTKKYVEILATFTVEGKIIPREIIWEDGRHFEIDRILEVQRGGSFKVGGTGIRYTCRIRNKQVYLFFEDLTGKWFMEVE